MNANQREFTNMLEQDSYSFVKFAAGSDLRESAKISGKEVLA